VGAEAFAARDNASWRRVADDPVVTALRQIPTAPPSRPATNTEEDPRGGRGE
jgi:hypothetical protein